MKLSVVIPAFNEQECLNRALSTLLNQTVPPHEIIVVDDGSDSPLSVPSGVRLIRIEREPSYRGSSEAKNRGAAAATGDWLAFTDDDILHMPDAIECVQKRLAQEAPRDDIMATVFSLGVPDGLLDICKWRPGDSKSMEALLACFRDQGKLYRFGKPDGLIPSRNAGPVTGLVLDVNEVLLISSEQHFGVISKRFFDAIGGYDASAFKTWGFNNQDLCLRVLKNGGWIVSNVMRPSGEALHCFHSRVTPHEPAEARTEFYTKYHQPYSPFMLLEAGRTCITRK